MPKFEHIAGLLEWEKNTPMETRKKCKNCAIIIYRPGTKKTGYVDELITYNHPWFLSQNWSTSYSLFPGRCIGTTLKLSDCACLLCLTWPRWPQFRWWFQESQKNEHGEIMIDHSVEFSWESASTPTLLIAWQDCYFFVQCPCSEDRKSWHLLLFDDDGQLLGLILEVDMTSFPVWI